MRRLLPLILILALLLCACGQRRTEPYALTVWHTTGDPLAPILEALAEDYNATRPRGTLAVEPRSFEDEDAISRALSSGAVPDLLLCGHAFAFSLADAGLLKPQTVAVAYPAWLQARSSCVGAGFYPVGFTLPLLCSPPDAPGDVLALLESAAAYGRATGEPWMSLDTVGPVFYQLLLEQGREFTADFQREVLNKDFVNLYNALATAVFDGGVTLDGRDCPCRVTASDTLPGEETDGCALRPLSEGALLAEGHGLAVLSRETRSQHSLGLFLSWLTEPGRLADAALNAGLVPALPVVTTPDDPLGAALAKLSGRELHLPDGESQYYRNKMNFEKQLRAALELLH